MATGTAGQGGVLNQESLFPDNVVRPAVTGVPPWTRDEVDQAKEILRTQNRGLAWEDLATTAKEALVKWVRQRYVAPVAR